MQTTEDTHTKYVSTIPFLTIYKALCHKIAFDIYIFYLLWSNVLALCQFKDILLPAMR